MFLIFAVNSFRMPNLVPVCDTPIPYGEKPCVPIQFSNLWHVVVEFADFAFK